MSEPLKIYLVSGEPSGDALGGALMSAIRSASDREVAFSGVGGNCMAEQGLESLFPLSELSLMGATEIITQLPRIFRLMKRTVAAIIVQQPDLLIIIDSPDFTHVVARRVRKQAPHIKIINYVSPTVWAWRPGRAKRMTRYVDKVLAIFPFEVDVHKKLSGPPCVYVGHPLTERVSELRGEAAENMVVGSNPKLLVMPGSRHSEIKRLMKPFGEALARVQGVIPDVEAILPVVPAVRGAVESAVETWAVKPRLVYTEEEKIAAFNTADAAMVASGTATLELALARVPMVAGYRVDWIVYKLKWFLQAHSVLLPNLIAGKNFVPELLHEDCNAEYLARETIALLKDSETRQRQLDGFQIVDEKLSVSGISPSQHAAAEIIALID